CFVQRKYQREPRDILVFKNGVNPSPLDERVQPADASTVMFLGQWWEGKGYRTLIEAATILKSRDLAIRWLVAGTRASDTTVLGCWPEQLRPVVEHISDFDRELEEELFARSNIFVLPSFCEGQPLSLLQAMEAGRCCITTDCCGQRELIRNDDNGILHE